MISPLAFVDPAAKLGKNVTVQPFAYIEGDVEIGDDCIIMSGARILDGTRLGQKEQSASWRRTRYHPTRFPLYG